MGQFWMGILIIAIAAAMGWWGTQVASEGWKQMKEKTTPSATSPSNQDIAADKDIYKLMVSSPMRFKYPGQLLFAYNSQLGKTISPISVALYVEVANNKPVISRIYSLESKALMQYDEGGKTQITTLPSGGSRFSYVPSGKIVERWRNLHSVGFLHDQIFFVTNDDWKKCKRIDFSSNSFEVQARDKQLQAGKSLKGWIFYELEEDLRVQLPNIKELEFTIKSSSGGVQTVKVDYPKEGEKFPVMSSGAWHILEGYYDLTKEKYSLCPQIDLHTILKKEREARATSTHKGK